MSPSTHLFRDHLLPGALVWLVGSIGLTLLRLGFGS